MAAPQNDPPSWKVLGDAELLPPFPAAHRSHASTSSRPPHRPWHQRLAARRLDTGPQPGLRGVQHQIFTRHVGSPGRCCPHCPGDRSLDHSHWRGIVAAVPKRLAAARLLLQKYEHDATEVQRLRQRPAGYLRSRQAFLPHVGSKAIRDFHRPQAVDLCLQSNTLQVQPSAVQTPRFRITVHDRHSPRPWARQRGCRRCLECRPSARQSPLKRWPKRKTPTQNSPPCCKDPGIAFEEDPDHRHGYCPALRHVDRQTTPGRPRNPPSKVFDFLHGETHFAAVRVAWRAEGQPHLGASMPVLPAVEDIQAHHNATRRLRSAHIPVPARTRRNRRPTASV